MLEKCAAAALAASKEEFILGSDKTNPAKIGNKISDLMKIYKNSSYALYTDELYIEYVKKQMENIVGDRIYRRMDDKDRARIILPIAFYSLIVLNEKKPVTVQRRSRKNHEFSKSKNDPGAPAWRIINPYVERKEVYRPSSDFKKLQENIHILSSAKVIAAFQSRGYLRSEPIEAAQKLPALDGKLHYLSCASSMAKKGAFLHDILEYANDSEYPLDVLLRMYCVSKLEDTLSACRLLVDDQITAVVNKQIMFKRYSNIDIALEYAADLFGYELHYNFDTDVVYPFPITFRSGKSSADLRKFQMTATRAKKVFSNYYTFLSNTFDFNFPNLEKFFLDKTKLEPLIDVIPILKQHIQMQKGLSTLIEKSKCMDGDITTVLYSLQLIKSRHDVFPLQSYISEYESFEEEQRLIRQKKEKEEENTIAVSSEIMDSPEWDMFFSNDDDFFLSDDDDSLADDGTNSNAPPADKWMQLEDELYNLVYRLTYEPKDFANNPEDREYLVKIIREKIDAVRSTEAEVQESE